MNPENTKSIINRHLEALRRFNKWEESRAEKMEDAPNMAAVFELYELIPKEARQRPVDVKGIMKMRRALACLK